MSFTCICGNEGITDGTKYGICNGISCKFLGYGKFFCDNCQDLNHYFELDKKSNRCINCCIWCKVFKGFNSRDARNFLCNYFDDKFIFLAKIGLKCCEYKFIMDEIDKFINYLRTYIPHKFTKKCNENLDFFRKLTIQQVKKTRRSLQLVLSGKKMKFAFLL